MPDLPAAMRSEATAAAPGSPTSPADATDTCEAPSVAALLTPPRRRRRLTRKQPRPAVPEVATPLACVEEGADYEVESAAAP